MRHTQRRRRRAAASAGPRRLGAGSTLACLAIATFGLALAAASGPARGEAIDWGDDSSVFAGDGECDDPRFEGPGMAKLLDEANRGADASDCRALFRRGRVAPRAIAASIDLGDDSGRWANDGECDDPRFEGEGMAAVLLAEDRGRDASDCRRLLEAGAIALRAEAPGAAPRPGAAPGVAFGDDSSRWANDGECDDPRFEGEGMAAVPLADDAMRDASDCRRLLAEGRIRLRR